jgi:hypothetical protein
MPLCLLHGVQHDEMRMANLTLLSLSLQRRKTFAEQTGLRSSLAATVKIKLDFDGKNALFLRQESLMVKVRMRYSRDEKGLFLALE